jgi:hypothetical protein
MGQQDLSMNEMPVHDHRQDWSDEHVTVKYLGFNRASGEAEFEVTEHHNNVGVYYIWVIYGGGGLRNDLPGQSAHTYDGAHPHRLELMRNINVRTGQDNVRGIKVKRIRD